MSGAETKADRPGGRVLRDWDKRPVYNFPPTIFVKQNSGGQQLDKVMSEVEEIRQAATDPSIPFDDLVHEIADLTHALETYWRIMERLRGRSWVQGIFNEVEIKNRRRCYYEEGAGQ